MNGIPSCRRALAGVWLPFLIEIGAVAAYKWVREQA